MRTPDSHRRTPIGFNMTPMIDVVFLLIIFFLVSSNMAREETQMELDLPNASTSQRREDEEVGRLIVVNVPAEGRVLVGSREIHPAELTTLLEYERSRDAEPLKVRIRTNADVPYRAIEPLLTASAKAGVWDVSFAVVRDP